MGAPGKNDAEIDSKVNKFRIFSNNFWSWYKVHSPFHLKIGKNLHNWVQNLHFSGSNFTNFIKLSKNVTKILSITVNFVNLFRNYWWHLSIYFGKYHKKKSFIEGIFFFMNFSACVWSFHDSLVFLLWESTYLHWLWMKNLSLLDNNFFLIWN